MNKEKQKAILHLKTAKGQIDSVLNMINDERYCIDISNQILAIQSLVKKANMLVLEQHLNHCVKEAFETGDVEAKTKEIMHIMNRMSGR